MIVALEESTKLNVFDGCYQNSGHARASVIELHPGWCILFREDLIHCGVGYSKVNFRLHCYVTIEGVRNPEGHVRIRKNRPKEALRKWLRHSKTHSAGGYRNHRKKLILYANTGYY
ncbi:Hypothetical protein PHPALM_540 [Phytophthora palmivora]|uniref:Uncharacterized protein n=1 Tax=Phytophthora palmivora TaxID=4796 RepID=A0A2P4YUL2_9STRA|nr:Hypothetical protein PHPALM_540 [Phytophthora palmivora]